MKTRPDQGGGRLKIYIYWLRLFFIAQIGVGLFLALQVFGRHFSTWQAVHTWIMVAYIGIALAGLAFFSIIITCPRCGCYAFFNATFLHAGSNQNFLRILLFSSCPECNRHFWRNDQTK
jgi:hypothetical protein